MKYCLKLANYDLNQTLSDQRLSKEDKAFDNQPHPHIKIKTEKINKYTAIFWTLYPFLK